MLKRIVLALIFVFTLAGLAQTRPRIPDNKELVTRARSLYVESDSVFMKRENLESSLLGRAEFKAWDLQITSNPRRADMWVRVRRVPFTNHFTYTVTDRETETIVMAGKVDSLAGTVYGLIADEIVHKMKTYRGDPFAQPVQQPSAASAKAPVDPNP